MCEREMLLRKVSEAQFAAFDLHLYLDSHPNCRTALSCFKKYNEMSAKFMAEYERKYGPLISSHVSSDAQCWQWVKDPWPWEYTRGAK